MKTGAGPRIDWDYGTAYDLFASLHVLHHPDKFGLRGSWAAGVRSRLTASERAVLEQAQLLFFSSPLAWVSALTGSKDSAAVLQALAQIPPAERLPTLAFHLDEPQPVLQVLKQVSDRHAWSEADLERLRQAEHPGKEALHPRELITSLEAWAHPDEFGESYLAALQAYVTVFFAEEEQRIGPYLQQALTRGQEMAELMDFPLLMVELSQGVTMAAFEQAEEIRFAPSYWTTPLVMFDSFKPGHWLVLFGARPSDVALVPGDVVPDAMLRALKALSDPTRLLILRYLSGHPLTPTQLARKLRLRPPTVLHHLSALRLAGLVYVSYDAAEEKRYTVRATAATETFETLARFLQVKSEE